MDFIRIYFFKLLFLLALFNPILLNAQGLSSSTYVPTVIPPSPNAAALMKFTDVPVSPYTGTADITVPIYTIQAKGISVPVSLSYHTGGIRLKEEASWVGLGWALNAGGMVSRTIMDQDDFGSIPYFTNDILQLAGDMSITHPYPATGQPYLGPYMYDFFCTYLAAKTTGNEDYWKAFTSGTAMYDMEPDIYSYSFPGHSGKFIITRTGKVVMQKQENISIQFQTNGSSFTITDDQGNKFFFNTLETCQTIGAATPTSSWLLSKIVTEQQDSVLINYTPGGGGVIVQPDVNQTFNAYCSNAGGPNSTNPPPTTYNNQTLQSIDFTNGRLLFLFDANRNDLNGAYKLDSIILYSKNSAGALIYQKEHDFYYSYFNGTYPSGNTYEFNRLKLDSVKEVSGGVSIPPYSFIYNSINPGANSAKHSFNVDHWGYFNGTANTVLIPTITTLYNPPGGNQQYFQYTGGNRLPNLEFMQAFSLQQITYPTGGKTALTYQANDYDFTNSSNNGSSGFQSLSLVTMDSVVNIVNHGTTSGTINLSTIFPLANNINNPSNLTVKITFRYQNNNTTTYQNSTGKIYFNFSGPGNVSVHQDINSATCQPGTPVCTISVPLTLIDTGTFSWSGYIDGSIDTVTIFSEIHVDFQYQETQYNYNLLENNSYISPASGLRVQNITNYSSAGTPASGKAYTYGYLQDKLGTGTPQQYSYGRLMSFPNYVRYISIATGNEGWCPSLSLFSSSNTSLTSVIQGNIVGYDQVTEYDIDPVTGLDNGKTVYNYFNSADTPISYAGFGLPGTLNMGNNLNGLLLSKMTYANNGGAYSKITESDNYFHTTNRIVYYSPKYVYIIGNNGFNGNLCTADTAVGWETNACFYPSIKSERILSDSSYNYAYDQSNPSNYVLKVSRSYYDNPVHYQMTRSNTIDSKGNSLTTHLKYPQDYIPNGQTYTGNTILDTMIGRNMVSETIEKQDSLYYSGSPTGYITGAQLSLFRQLGSGSLPIVPDKIYKLDIQAPIINFQPFSFTGNTTSMDSRSRLMASFDQYDAYNNMQQYTTTDQNPVAIIWDYSHVYPIAQAKNAVITDVAATSFEADGYGNWSPYTGTVTNVTTAPFPPTGNNYYNLTTSATLSKSGLVSGNVYIVSYWSKNGAYSISGGTGSSVTGKTINGWTYYEHKITSSSTTLTISGTGAIDEVRLYPSTALMTTYTYSPLVGMTTTCDPDNKVTYYFFDGFGRLKWVKDQDGNILKTMRYHYLGGQ
ncbi:MAG TPA: hypothetical protein VGZ90_00625 [Puia sp.]|jgi:hypothetical protein|nr:hypothetical protein [Puia sp.]